MIPAQLCARTDHDQLPLHSVRDCPTEEVPVVTGDEFDRLKRMAQAAAGWIAPEGLPSTGVYAAVHRERERAHLKHGAAGNSREDQPWDNPEWLPILMEEVGEVAHELTYDANPSGYVTTRLRAELVQVAAMACAWIDAIDRAGE